MPTDNMSKFDQFDAKLKKLMRAIATVAGVVLIIVMLIAVVNALTQKFFSVSVPNSTDLIAHLLVPLVYLAFPAVVISDKGPLSADVLSKVLPKFVKDIVAVFSYLLGIGICGFITWRVYIYAAKQIANKMTNSVGDGSFALWPFSACLCVGMALATLCTIYTLIRFFVHKKQTRFVERSQK